MAEITYLERPVYDFGAIDSLLGLTAGTARRWIDGYERRGRLYEPVVRERSTGVEVATWGEFVETEFLASYRDAGVPMIRMRPIVAGLREQFGVRYPLATVQPYVDDARRVVYELQEEEELEQSMRLVVEAQAGQLTFAPQVQRFKKTVQFEETREGTIVTRLLPLGSHRKVVIDPLKRFGAPVVRSVPTEVLASLVRAGEPIEWVAEQYELELDDVLDALEYERQQAA